MEKSAKYLAFPIAFILCVYIAICAFLFLYQRSFLYYPTPVLPQDTSPTITFQNNDANLVVSVHQNTGSQAVLYFGGNGEFVSTALPQLIATFSNASIYALHYRSYSGSTGTPTEKNIIADGLTLFDLIYKEHKEVTIIGRSLGSGVAIQVASLRPASRLVLVTPYNSILEIAKERFKYVPLDWLLEDKYESWRFAPQISIPTTVIAAENDVVIPLNSTKRLIPYFKNGVASLIVITGAGHNDISNHSEYIPALLGYLK